MSAVYSPKHYTSHPSGVECIQITEHFGFNVGNAVKYLWRCGLKGDEVEDLEKARWYIDREIARRKMTLARGLDFRWRDRTEIAKVMANWPNGQGAQ